MDTHAVGAYGQYGDELKIKKKVLTDIYPTLCDHLMAIFGDDPEGSSDDGNAVSRGH